MSKMQDYVCAYCSTDFQRYPYHVRVDNPCCSVSCYRDLRVIRDSTLLTSYSSILLPDHPLATRSGVVQRHRYVLFQKIGNGPHDCYWCGVELNWVVGKSGGGEGALVVDHLDGQRRNNSPENLVPACQKCNVGRSNPDLIDDREVFITQTLKGGKVRKHRATKLTCRHCGLEFLCRTARIRFKGEIKFCSQRCSGLDRWRRPDRGGFGR